MTPAPVCQVTMVWCAVAWSPEMSPLLLLWWCGVVCTVGAGATLHSLCTTAGARPGRYILTYNSRAPAVLHSTLNTTAEGAVTRDT